MVARKLVLQATAWLVFTCSIVNAEPAAFVRSVIDTLCHRGQLTGLEAQLAIEGSWLLEEEVLPNPETPRVIMFKMVLTGGAELTIERLFHNGRLRQMRVGYFENTEAGPLPTLLAIADGACRIQSGREIRREGEANVYLDQLDGDLSTLRWTETLQAPWPSGQDRGGIRVGLVDSGLAYDLDVFRDRLARDATGDPLGYDYWDMDPWPYDGDVSRGAFLPIRHGTAVASVLVREAPDAALVPYRYPRPDMTRMGALVANAARDGVRILAMPLGSTNRQDWIAFEAALGEHDILAIVSAGNDGRDIDSTPIYPAALPSDRILTVKSADAFGKLAEGSNWGRQHVDIMLPAENLPVIDFRGASGAASGSSYAVPRIAAMAARLLEREPGLTAIQLKSRVLARAAPSPFEREGLLAKGWIPDPLAD